MPCRAGSTRLAAGFVTVLCSSVPSSCARRPGTLPCSGVLWAPAGPSLVGMQLVARPLSEGGSSPAGRPSLTAGDKDQARRRGLQDTHATRSAARPLGNIYPSSVSQKGDAAATKICKLSFTAASYLP